MIVVVVTLAQFVGSFVYGDRRLCYWRKEVVGRCNYSV